MLSFLNSFESGVSSTGRANSIAPDVRDATECGVPSGAILFAYRNFIEN